MRITFINQTGESNKFWTIDQSGNSYSVQWGRIGTAGRTNTKEFSNSDDCSKEVAKLINEKITKGYTEIESLDKLEEKKIAEYQPMNEDIFWEIIGSLNWKKTGDDDAVLRPALKRLITMTAEDIYLFADILAEKLYLLDGIQYASNIGEDSYKGKDEYFSIDNFLYVRCCVVANGREYFEYILDNPTEMPKDMEFESLLYLPAQAYNTKTKTEDYKHITPLNFETFSNKEGWNL